MEIDQLVGMIVWFDVAIFQRPSPNTYRRRVDTVVHHLLSEPVGLPVEAVIVKDALDDDLSELFHAQRRVESVISLATLLLPGRYATW
jgi:hypothetical protein